MLKIKNIYFILKFVNFDVNFQKSTDIKKIIYLLQ